VPRPKTEKPASEISGGGLPQQSEQLGSKLDSTNSESRQVSQCVPATMPVELLRDRHGIYGIGVSSEYDHEALAWTCGAEADAFGGPCGHTPRPLILRPDLFERTKVSGSVLQKIIGGFRHGIFCHSAEERLRQFVHHEALRRAGLPWPPEHHLDYRNAWWSSDKAQQARNRRTYHGFRVFSLCVVNRLIGTLHEAVADPDAIRVARRFTHRHREEIYRAAALSSRARQLADTFPVVALATYTDWWHDHDGWTIATHQQFVSRQSHQRQEAASLVERGARLRDVAAALGFPLALRHVKPGAAHLVDGVFIQHPELLQCMPATTPAASIWLRCVEFAFWRGGADYAHWVARRAPEMPGRLNQVADTVSDVLDWVLANAGKSGGRQFVTRPFTPAMGLKAAIQASRDWHEAVASNMDDSPEGLALPPPWYPAAIQGDFEIVPVTTAVDLYREGHEMHHCVATYADDIRNGTSYVFSVRQNCERVATMSLVRDCARILIDQVRGPCNTAPPKAIMTAVRQWLREREA
jgi:PcfJ-like protein